MMISNRLLYKRLGTAGGSTGGSSTVGKTGCRASCLEALPQSTKATQLFQLFQSNSIDAGVRCFFSDDVNGR